MEILEMKMNLQSRLSEDKLINMWKSISHKKIYDVTNKEAKLIKVSKVAYEYKNSKSYKQWPIEINWQTRLMKKDASLSIILYKRNRL